MKTFEQFLENLNIQNQRIKQASKTQQGIEKQRLTTLAAQESSIKEREEQQAKAEEERKQARIDSLEKQIQSIQNQQ